MQITTETKVGIFVLGALGILLYMSMHVGAFRLDKRSYKRYSVFFQDIAGLEKKADVKIAGVKVGWVDEIQLGKGHDAYHAKAHIRVHKEYTLYADAHAQIKQESLLGTKYLDLNPGDPHLPKLPEDHSLSHHALAPVSLEDIMHKVHTITSHVVDVTQAFHEAFATSEGKSTFQSTMQHFNNAAEKISAFADALDRTLSGNETTINAILSDIRDIAREMREALPPLSTDLSHLTKKVESDFLPSFQASIERMSQVFDRDVSTIAQRLTRTSDALEGAAQQAQEGFKNIQSITDKIDSGQGLIGKLINEGETYDDIRLAVGGIKSYFNKVDRLNVIIDAHGEYMYRPAEHLVFEDAKGYLDVRIHPNDDHFYLLQRITSDRGNLKRRSLIKNWYDENDKQFLPSDFFKGSIFASELIGRVETIERELDAPRYGVQVGKIFKDVALRFGLIEGWAGVGIDVDIPFGTDKFRWVTTFEAFDFKGRWRINDSRPHLKWINRVFLFRNLYSTFGLDDFISRENSSGFFGLGVRFCDDDLKYLVAKLGFLGGTGE